LIGSGTEVYSENVDDDPPRRPSCRARREEAVMPVREILELGNPILREKSSPVEEPSSAPVSELINDLEDTLAAVRDDRGFGRGIAAPQIGVLKRVVLIDTQSEGFRGALINPEITSESSERYDMWDSCFCFPELLVRVARASEVRVEYVDRNGAPQTLEATGELASLLQHEIDHLDGVLAVEKVVSPRDFMSRAEWERQGRPF
jgi:peptide deformylase